MKIFNDYSGIVEPDYAEKIGRFFIYPFHVLVGKEYLGNMKTAFDYSLEQKIMACIGIILTSFVTIPAMLIGLVFKQLSPSHAQCRKAHLVALQHLSQKVGTFSVIHTLGDSTLDNVYWLLNSSGSNAQEAKANSVEGQLEALLQPSKYKLRSHAYDGFTTKSVLDTDRVGRVLSIDPLKDLGDKQKVYLENRGIHPKVQSYDVSPLKALKESIEEEPNVTHYVAISVGGNDLRELLSNPSAILTEIPSVQKRYMEILDKVKGLAGNGRIVRPIIISLYRVDAKQDEPYHIYDKLSQLADHVHSAAMPVIDRHKRGVAVMGALLESMYKPILEQAKAEGIPVLDLSNTFDPYEDLYTCQIEPNKKGAALIAKGIDHIVKNHDFTSQISKTYAKPKTEGSYIASDTDPSGWRVHAASVS